MRGIIERHLARTEVHQHPVALRFDIEGKTVRKGTAAVPLCVFN